MLNQASHEKRREERVAVKHLVDARNTKGMTHDISASGVFFELDAIFVLGDLIDFVIEFGKQGVNFILKCIGEIVRVETRNGKVGVAVKISQSVMQST